MSFSKDPNAIVLGTHAAALLFLGGSTVLVLHARGERDIPSTLGFREGMEGPSTPLSADASKREFGGTSTNVLSANHTCQVSLIWLLAQPVGDSTSVQCGRVLKVLGVKRVAGRQNPGAPKCKYVIGLNTLMTHQPVGGRLHATPELVEEGQGQRRACRSALRVSIGGAPRIHGDPGGR